MGKERKEITELKCRDCLHFVLSGWWDPQRVCEISGFPVDKDSSACISVLTKKNKTQYKPLKELESGNDDI